LCDGVELLKNRGYDSAGIFRYGPKLDGKLVKYADEGTSALSCIDQVIDEVLTETGISTVGIAHTRWATCGQRVSKNAHPHNDCMEKIYIVHNGIISNYSDIKNTYLSDIKLDSETDTEIIAQFLGVQRR
jgi:glucosamine--fructose-6-phosphate aminotransferase (isomerizing)